jgi:hypothetical protein
MLVDSGDPSLLGSLTTESPEAAVTPPAHCRHCGSPDVVITRCRTGPHFARVRCPECGRADFAKTPWSLDRARAFVMPWGKYRGKKLADLTATEEGRGYLQWLAAEVEENVSTAARILLDPASQTSSDGPSPDKKAPSTVVRSTGTSEATPPLAESRESP